MRRIRLNLADRGPGRRRCLRPAACLRADTSRTAGRRCRRRQHGVAGGMCVVPHGLPPGAAAGTIVAVDDGRDSTGISARTRRSMRSTQASHHGVPGRQRGGSQRQSPLREDRGVDSGRTRRRCGSPRRPTYGPSTTRSLPGCGCGLAWAAGRTARPATAASSGDFSERNVTIPAGPATVVGARRGGSRYDVESPGNATCACS